MNTLHQKGMDWSDWDGKTPDPTDPYLLTGSRLNDEETHLLDADGTPVLELSGAKPSVDNARVEIARRLAEQLWNRLPVY